MRVKSGKIEILLHFHFSDTEENWDLKILRTDGFIHEENIDDEILRYN